MLLRKWTFSTATSYLINNQFSVEHGRNFLFWLCYVIPESWAMSVGVKSFWKSQKVKPKVVHLKKFLKAALFWSEWFWISALFWTDIFWQSRFFLGCFGSAAVSWINRKVDFCSELLQSQKKAYLQPFRRNFLLWSSLHSKVQHYTASTITFVYVLVHFKK